ncbi:hypothetical protein EYF80_014993 [Liparis tanakae]|uniref:Uncharacterized protein n=1 Tax=Liparis tanakae TaxID=230148 RepID=A0A4Z2IB63_9TELE|nr:hypothetical protein EYF80_014993 [Liparis tanakae]
MLSVCERMLGCGARGAAHLAQGVPLSPSNDPHHFRRSNSLRCLRDLFEAPSQAKCRRCLSGKEEVTLLTSFPEMRAADKPAGSAGRSECTRAAVCYPVA